MILQLKLILFFFSSFFSFSCSIFVLVVAILFCLPSHLCHGCVQHKKVVKCPSSLPPLSISLSPSFFFFFFLGYLFFFGGVFLKKKFWFFFGGVNFCGFSVDVYQYLGSRVSVTVSIITRTLRAWTIRNKVKWRDNYLFALAKKITKVGYCDYFLI